MSEWKIEYPVLTAREIMATVAMHGMCGGGEWTNPKAIASQAYKIADAMLEAAAPPETK